VTAPPILWAKHNSRVNEYGNDIEHYFSALSHNAVRALITDSFVVIRDFIRNQLGQDPLSLLGSPTWGVLTNVAEVYEKEKQECTEHIEAVEWKYDCLGSALIEYRCPKCGSGLIDVTANGADRETAAFTCRSCGEQWSFEDLAPLAISDYFAEENYRSIKDGGEPVTITCLECDEDTYLLDDDICILCEESTERRCQMCGIEIPPEEIDGEGYCSWCTHMMSKDD
jgi:transposase-like protein